MKSAGVVTTDMTGTGYEVTATKADGSAVEVHNDSSFNVKHGGHGGHGGGRPNDNDADGAPASGSSSTTTG